MKRWERADNYMGHNYNDYFVLLTQTRDSDILEESNFSTALKLLGGESDTVIVVRSSHWAVGWIEFLLIHESDLKAIEKGNEIEDQIKNYPILDEDDYSDRESDINESSYTDWAKHDFIRGIEKKLNIYITEKDEDKIRVFFFSMADRVNQFFDHGEIDTDIMIGPVEIKDLDEHDIRYEVI